MKRPPESLRALPLEGDAAHAAGRPLHGGHWFRARRFLGLGVARSAIDN